MLFPSTGHAEENWATNSRTSECLTLSFSTGCLASLWTGSMAEINSFQKKKKRLLLTQWMEHTQAPCLTPSAPACLLG